MSLPLPLNPTAIPTTILSLFSLPTGPEKFIQQIILNARLTIKSHLRNQCVNHYNYYIYNKLMIFRAWNSHNVFNNALPPLFRQAFVKSNRFYPRLNLYKAASVYKNSFIQLFVNVELSMTIIRTFYIRVKFNSTAFD
jgi:hypothetical protein